VGHSPEDLSRAEYHRRVAEPITQASDSRRIGITSAIFVRAVINVRVALVIAVTLALTFDETDAFTMRLARIYQQDQLAGLLEARDDGTYRFTYDTAFHGEPVSLTMPASQQVWEFPRLPAPFEGLLPEGVQLEALLRLRKLDRHDLFSQLLAVGRDVVGSLRIEAAP
jgi:serine/threonine-protein kinase HipA